MVDDVRFLADTSAWKKNKHSLVKAWFDDAALAGRVVLCDQVILELLYEPSRWDVYQQLNHALSGFPRVATVEYDWLRAREVQGMLAALRHGEHRGVKIPDLLIAATAERNDLVLLHYDQDFDDISTVTGQPTQWVGPRGQL